jgi:hypothetical protein
LNSAGSLAREQVIFGRVNKVVEGKMDASSTAKNIRLVGLLDIAGCVPTAHKFKLRIRNLVIPPNFANGGLV